MRTNYLAVDKTHRPAVHPGLPGTTSTAAMCCWAATSCLARAEIADEPLAGSVPQQRTVSPGTA
jgi:hypothetical protein